MQLYPPNRAKGVAVFEGSRIRYNRAIIEFSFCGNDAAIRDKHV